MTYLDQLESMIKDFDIKSVNPLQAYNSLQAMDWDGMFSDLGLTGEEISQIKSGDYSPIEKKFSLDRRLDWETVMGSMDGVFSRRLISFFFDKAKLGQPFTENETEAFGGVYREWFSRVFEMAPDAVFMTDIETNDMSIRIVRGDDEFQMSRMDGIDVITYIGQSK